MKRVSIINMDVWDKKFLELAAEVGGWSKDPSTKVGAVIVDSDNTIVSMGYNGFPRGVKDDFRLDDRDTKYKLIVHAEANAIVHAKRCLKNCTIYTMPFMPCSRCAGLIIQAGIQRVVSMECYEPRWIENFKLSNKVLREAGIVVELF